MIVDGLREVDVAWLRPQWLWALLALPVFGAAWWRRRARGGWERVVDAHLLPHLLEPAHRRRGIVAALASALVFCLAVIALAGPSLGRSPAPAWQVRMPLVVVLDLSSAMRAADIAPSRLAVARAKLATLLRMRTGAPVALVAFAGAPFTVAPLTDDVANVALFLDALDPGIMPVDGRDTAAALVHAADRLARAGHARGRVLLVSDGADGDAIAQAAELRARGVRVDVLGVGGAAGAPLRTPDGLRTVRLDAGSLQALAVAGGGRYATIAAGDADLRSLGVADAAAMDGVAGAPRGQARRDDGIWLVPPLLLLGLLAFRRRASGLVVVAALALLPLQVRAADPWRRPDQAAHARMVDGHRAYRERRFEEAARAYAQADGADAHYNRGNALAKAGQYAPAIAAYDEALRLQPGMADARANREAVRRAMQRKPPPGKNDRPSARQGKKGRNSQGGSAGADAERDAPNRPDPPPPAAPPRAADASAQSRADAAMRERLRSARAQAGTPKPADTAARPARRAETQDERERRLANEAWLRRVPDDPGALLRAKFRLEYERRQREGRAP